MQPENNATGVMIVGAITMRTRCQILFLKNCGDGDVIGVRNHLANLNNVDLNGRDSRNMTPLMLAAHEGHIEVVRLLLNARADTSVVDEMRPDRPCTALDYAMGCGLPIVYDDSEDEGGPQNPHTDIAALIISAMAGPVRWS